MNPISPKRIDLRHLLVEAKELIPPKPSTAPAAQLRSPGVVVEEGKRSPRVVVEEAKRFGVGPRCSNSFDATNYICASMSQRGEHEHGLIQSMSLTWMLLG